MRGGTASPCSATPPTTSKRLSLPKHGMHGALSSRRSVMQQRGLRNRGASRAYSRSPNSLVPSWSSYELTTRNASRMRRKRCSLRSSASAWSWLAQPRRSDDWSLQSARKSASTSSIPNFLGASCIKASHWHFRRGLASVPRRIG